MRGPDRLVGLFDAFRHRQPASDPLAGGADGCFDVLGADGRLVRYTPRTTSTRSG